MGIILTLSTIVGLIRRHVGTAEQFIAIAAEAGSVFTRDDGTVVPADRVSLEIDEALAKAADVSDNAAGRIDARHAGD